MPYSALILLSGSRAVRKETLTRDRKRLYAFSSLSTLTPSTTTPEFAKLPLKLVERGDFLDAGRAPGGPEVQHQQLCRRNSSAETVRPLSAVMEKSGAESPTSHDALVQWNERSRTRTTHSSTPIETCRIRSVLHVWHVLIYNLIVSCRSLRHPHLRC